MEMNDANKVHNMTSTSKLKDIYIIYKSKSLELIFQLAYFESKCDRVIHWWHVCV